MGDEFPGPEDEFIQEQGICMLRDGNVVMPDFRFDVTPTKPSNENPPTYPLKTVPDHEVPISMSADEPPLYPEMRFIKLAKQTQTDRTIPDTRYVTHGLHNHPATFIPHIPYYLIHEFTSVQNNQQERTLVLDPFCGSGTVGIESKLSGRDFVGVEVNPLSILISRVATSPIPPSLLDRILSDFENRLHEIPVQRYDDFDVPFPDRTEKQRWFEPEVIDGLSTIRKITREFFPPDISYESVFNTQEQAVIDDLSLDITTLQTQLERWLILAIANTVFHVSNADPNIAKAHKSSRIHRKLDENKHPPDVLDTHLQQLQETAGKLSALWNEIYGLGRVVGAQQTRLWRFTERTQSSPSDEQLASNHAHAAETSIYREDARSFDLPEAERQADIAITSPPYINAVHYYRSTKLRLFWIWDFLQQEEDRDTQLLRDAILGSNPIKKTEINRDLPVGLDVIWEGRQTKYKQTRLPQLDQDIAAIYSSDYADAAQHAYRVWYFFSDGMVRSLTRVYEHLKPGGLFFFIVGNNTVCGQRIQTSEYVADIARYLGNFSTTNGTLNGSEGFRLIGTAWDRITRRDLFEDRANSSDLIECEWVVMLQKPP